MCNVGGSEGCMCEWKDVRDACVMWEGVRDAW